MKITINTSRYLIRAFFLLLVSLVVSSCTIPTAQPTTAPTDTISGVTDISPTHTPVGAWATYRNTEYGFQLSYPEPGQLMEGADGHSARIDLPYTPGTNLQEKYAQIDVQENPDVCSSPLAQGYESGTLQVDQVTINGSDFHTISGSEGAAGNIYEWTAYSATKNGICVSISFVLHATNPFNYPTPPPEFDRSSESGVFMEIISTFTWTE
jgi:hypothetical protein